MCNRIDWESGNFSIPPASRKLPQINFPKFGEKGNPNLFKLFHSPIKFIVRMLVAKKKAKWGLILSCFLKQSSCKIMRIAVNNKN
jgi:hypothetical protein